MNDSEHTRTGFFTNPADDLAEELPMTVGELSKRVGAAVTSQATEEKKSLAPNARAAILLGILIGLTDVSVDDLLGEDIDDVPVG